MMTDKKKHLFRVWICIVVLILCLSAAAMSETQSNKTAVLISFDFQRQSTMASNQIALWVEDEEGHAVRTLLATSFTAGRRGYRNRDMSLAAWVASSQPEALSQNELDAISSATPSSGHLEYLWDLTDDQGNPVPEGFYRIRLEGTLFWESAVLYTAEIKTGEEVPGSLQIEMERNQPDNHENETMIENVTMTVHEEKGVNP